MIFLRELKKYYKRSKTKQIKFQKLFDEYEIYLKDTKLKQIRFVENEDDDEREIKRRRQKDKKMRPGLTECITVVSTLDCEANEINSYD